MEQASGARILLVKLADLGDLVTATPAIQAVLDSFPDARVTVLTTPHAAPLLRALAGRLDVLEFPKAAFDSLAGALRPGRLLAAAGLFGRLRELNPTSVAILHHLTTTAGVAKYRALAAATGATQVAGLDNGRGSFLTTRAEDAGFGVVDESEYWLRVVEAMGATRPADTRTRVWPDAAEFDRGRARGGELGRWVAIHPGTGPAAPARLWPAAHFAALIEGLRAGGGATPILVGGDGDAAQAQAVQGLLSVPAPEVLGGMTIGESAGLVSTAEQFIGSDSGLLHVAAAVGVRCVGLYGPTDPGAWAPTGPGVTVVRSPVACSPCLYQPGRPPLQVACAAPFCMHAIVPEDVLRPARSAA
jgi:ADP-heptose:LPS heptosyltransferase